MKIVCTLKEFEILLARCPWGSFLIEDDKFDKLMDECKDHCLLYNFCRHGKKGCDIDDPNWTLADLVEIVPSTTSKNMESTNKTSTNTSVVNDNILSGKGLDPLTSKIDTNITLNPLTSKL